MTETKSSPAARESSSPSTPKKCSRSMLSDSASSRDCHPGRSECASLREATHSRSRRVPFLLNSVPAWQGILCTFLSAKLFSDAHWIIHIGDAYGLRPELPPLSRPLANSPRRLQSRQLLHISLWCDRTLPSQ